MLFEGLAFYLILGRSLLGPLGSTLSNRAMKSYFVMLSRRGQSTSKLLVVSECIVHSHVSKTKTKKILSQ